MPNNMADMTIIPLHGCADELWAVALEEEFAVEYDLAEGISRCINRPEPGKLTQIADRPARLGENGEWKYGNA